MGRQIARGLADLIDLLLELGQLGLAHRFLKLSLELGGHPAHLADPLPGSAQHRRQLLRPDHDERDDADDDKLSPVELQHLNSNSKGRGPRSSAISK